MSERLTKHGSCAQCQRSDLNVSWHPGSRTFYCNDCWPSLHESRSEEKRTARLETFGQLTQRRDRLYGFRVEDDPHAEHVGSFVAICPEHGVLGDDMTITIARRARDNHVLSHSP